MKAARLLLHRGLLFAQNGLAQCDGTDVMILKIFSPKNCRRSFLHKPLQVFAKNIITLVFEKKRQSFRRKLSKIAENCGHNIDPRWLCKEIAQLPQNRQKLRPS
jgi:hypothetical protein